MLTFKSKQADKCERQDATSKNSKQGAMFKSDDASFALSVGIPLRPFAYICAIIASQTVAGIFAKKSEI